MYYTYFYWDVGDVLGFQKSFRVSHFMRSVLKDYFLVISIERGELNINDLEREKK